MKCEIISERVKVGCRGKVKIKDPVPLHVMDWEWGGVKCDFGANNREIFHQSLNS